jgi:hypothetical protein
MKSRPERRKEKRIKKYVERTVTDSTRVTGSRRPKECAACKKTFWTHDRFEQRCDPCAENLKQLKARALERLNSDRAEMEIVMAAKAIIG